MEDHSTPTATQRHDRDLKQVPERRMEDLFPRKVPNRPPHHKQSQNHDQNKRKREHTQPQLPERPDLEQSRPGARSTHRDSETSKRLKKERQPASNEPRDIVRSKPRIPERPPQSRTCQPQLPATPSRPNHTHGPLRYRTAETGAPKWGTKGGTKGGVKDGTKGRVNDGSRDGGKDGAKDGAKDGTKKGENKGYSRGDANANGASNGNNSRAKPEAQPTRGPQAPPPPMEQAPVKDSEKQTTQVPKSGILYRDQPVFEQIQQVGEGTYGRVYKASNRDTGCLVALKRLRLDFEREGLPITAVREIKLLQSLRHLNIVALREMVVSGKNVYMAFEYLEHDLAGLLLNPDLQLTPGNIKSLFRQLVDGLAYLHHKAIVHRDIKGSNILVNAQGQIKLADFGLARSIDLENPNAHYTNRVITLWYRPPELLFGATKYGTSVDVWGIGCLLAELFMRKALFQGKDEISQLDAIVQVLGMPSANEWPELPVLPWYNLVVPKQGEGEGLENRLTGVSDSCFDLAASLLTMNPHQRLSAKDALSHPYFKEAPAEEPICLQGEWHDFEAKQRRKMKKTNEQTDSVRGDSGRGDSTKGDSVKGAESTGVLGSGSNVDNSSNPRSEESAN